MGKKNWPKSAKKSQKSQNSFFLINTVTKLLSEVEQWTVKSDNELR